MMARKDPLAPGVYWFDFRPDNHPRGGAMSQEQAFDQWLAVSPSVKVLTRERAASAEVLYLVVFEVTGPLVASFPRSMLGSPTIQKLASAPGGVTDSDRAIKTDDVTRTPDPYDVSLDQAGRFLHSVADFGQGLGLLLLLGLALVYGGKRGS